MMPAIVVTSLLSVASRISSQLAIVASSIFCHWLMPASKVSCSSTRFRVAISITPSSHVFSVVVLFIYPHAVDLTTHARELTVCFGDQPPRLNFGHKGEH